MRGHRILAVAITLLVCLSAVQAWAQAGGGGGGGGGGGTATGGGGTGGAVENIGEDIQLQTEILDLANAPVGGIAAAEDAVDVLSSTAALAAELANQQTVGGQQNFAQRTQDRNNLTQGAGQQGNVNFYMLRPIFTVPNSYRVAAPPPVTDLNNRVQRAMARSSLAGLPVQVTMDGPTAILRGEVALERDRRLLETTIRLEPGVRSIRNEIQVVETLQTPPSPSDDSSDASPPVLEGTALFDQTPMLLD